MLKIAPCLSVIILFFANSFCADLIIDKQGNEIEVFIVSSTNDMISYRTDSLETSPLKTINQSEVFMIKYGNGQKKVFTVAPQIAIEDTAEQSKKFSLTLLGNLGVFGLFNVDNVFTKASYTVGFTPNVEYRISRQFALGGECMVLMGKPETSDSPRLLINPNVRLKAFFLVHPKIKVEPLIAFGCSIWPKSEGTPVLDATLLDSRVGWDARAAIGLDWQLSTTFSAALEAGYSASSSESGGVWITHDMMMVSIGPRVRF